MPDLNALPRDRLEDMAIAGSEALECRRVLAATGDTVVSEVLRDQGAFAEWTHYPKGDVYDRRTHSQYYYHAHPQEKRSREHGHFHTFLRAKGMPGGVAPADLPDLKPPKDKNGPLSHLVGISMNRRGIPIRLFTTNRWVTGETWFAASDVIAMLDCFKVDHARPSWPTNKWVGAMLRLFRPEIEELIAERDRTVADWRERHQDENIYEDRKLEITSALDISVERQVRKLHRALGLPES